MLPLAGCATNLHRKVGTELYVVETAFDYLKADKANEKATEKATRRQTRRQVDNVR